MKRLSEIDPDMQIENPQLQDMYWLSAFDDSLTRCGFAWNLEQKLFRRLPSRELFPDIPERVDYLATHASGGQIRFQSNSRRVGMRIELKKPADMVHMPATGQSGCDLYIKKDAGYVFCGAKKYDHKQSAYDLLLFTKPDSWDDSVETYCLNMPLYEEVLTLSIAFDAPSQVSPFSGFSNPSPIVVYGTSITQGACASRPGMSHTNMLSRALDCEIINLGFAGNGRGEPVLAACIGEIQNPAMIVLDYEANAGLGGLQATLPAFIDVLREQHQRVPIVLVSAPPRAQHYVDAEARAHVEHSIQWQRQFISERQLAGDTAVFFLDGSTAIRDAFMEATVDGIHPTDYGFQLMAELWEPAMRKILNL